MRWVWPEVWDNEGGRWWRVATTLLLFIAGMLAGNFLLLLIASFGVNEFMNQQPLLIQQLVRPLGIVTASSLAMLGCLVGVQHVHHKPVACVFTDGRAFKFGFALQSALLWLGLWFVSTCLISERYERLGQRAQEFPIGGWVLLAGAMVCATSVQGTLEEVVFRGYLQPRIGAWLKKPWITVAVVGVIFAAVHIDAWTRPGILYTAGFSAAFGIGAVRAGTLAPLCGLHAAHNAAEFLFFPHESLAATTWPMTVVTIGALAVWLVWLFWMTRQKRLAFSPQEESRH